MAPTRPLRQDELERRKRHDDSDPTTILEKDETEKRLEKILFGDQAGFLDALKSGAEPQEKSLQKWKRYDEDEDISDEDMGGQDVDTNMQDVADEDLFFLDAGPDSLPQAIAQDLQGQDVGTDLHDRQLAWVDSDDERLTISLASNTRLRKLRDTEEDDMVTGTEYIQRLRRQYERLHPTPGWVKYARKKRRLSQNNGAGAGSDSDSDQSLGEDDTSSTTVQPLAELLRSGGALVRSIEPPSQRGVSKRKLRPEVLDIQRVKDVSGSGPSSIDVLQFHPYYPLILSAGPSSTITLHHISPQPPNPNPVVTSLHIKGTPLHTAAFCTSAASPNSQQDDTSTDNTRIFLSARRRYFHTWTLSSGTINKVSRPLTTSSQALRSDQRSMESFKLSPCGRYMGLIGTGKKGGGTVNVIDTGSMQWICSCRIDSGNGVADFAWWRDGNGFCVVGKNGEVNEYDIQSRAVLGRWIDEGAVGTTVIALGGDNNGRSGAGADRWVALGSSSGVVNIYDRRDWGFEFDKEAAALGSGIEISKRPKPTRVFDHLTTPTSHLEFSHDGQMLVMGSRWKKNALRLVHLPSCTVYRNWPTDKTPLGRITSVALSRDGGYLAVGNEQGKIRLWQIRD